MSESKRAGDRRAQHVALLGCVIQFVAFGAVLALSFGSESYILDALSRFLLFGVPIWLVLYLALNQLRRVSLESLETEELRRAQEEGGSRTIFELDDEGLLLERNRLQGMARWMLPACTILVALLLLPGHFFLWSWSLDDALTSETMRRTANPTLVMWFVVGTGFAFFMSGRYALAVARLPAWRLLRAGAVCMSGGALACFAVAIALMVSTTIEWAEPAVTYALRVALMLLGLEFAVNFILDLYRPRVPGEIPRPSFDSRLLGMISEPGDMAKSIADAANYQFGFQVSSTWFYQLLQRWLFPITVVAMMLILALTGVVIVDADEQVVVERFGRLRADSVGVLSPGIHFKLPYPIDIVHRAPVKRINELVIGEPAEDDHDHGDSAIIWTEEHEFVAEMMLLVASSPSGETAFDQAAPESAGAAPTESVAVSLLMVSVPIEYRIKDLRSYLYRYADPEKLIENVAHQYLSDFAASVDVDELIGPGREAFNKELRKLIQDRLDELDIGIEICFVGIRGAHPPARSGVAAAYQGVVSAETNMGAILNAAKGEAQKILIAVAGKESRANALDEAIRMQFRFPLRSPEQLAARQHVKDLLLGDRKKGISPASGEAARLIAEARASASIKRSGAAAKARVFGTQVAAYLSARELYLQRKTLEIYEDLADVRKYLIVGDRSNVIIEYQTSREAGLDEVLASGVEDERRKSAGRAQRNP